jgi:predicted RNase H-like HicB family nuclease
VLSFHAVYRKVPEGFVAVVEELPGANAQASTLAKARENLREAVELVVQASREMSAKELQGADVIREPLDVSA